MAAQKHGIGGAKPATGPDAEKGAASLEARSAHRTGAGAESTAGVTAAAGADAQEQAEQQTAAAHNARGSRSGPKGGAGSGLHAGRSELVFGPLSGLAGSIDAAKTLIVTEPEVRRLHGIEFPACPVIEVERGEAAKSLGSLEKLYASFLGKELDRSSTVLGIGGGTVSDLAGFAASTWMRGIDFAFAPTTLLAMVDASVGGKNGIDFNNYKNLIGTFNEPRFVYFDVTLLGTLPALEFASGMAEVIKHSVIDNSGYLDFLEAECPDYATLFGAEPAARTGADTVSRRAEQPMDPVLKTRLEELVRRSLVVKAAVVEEDEREAGRRRVLNLGHTIGHAVEEVTGIPHGFAVAAGLASALRLAVIIADFPEEDAGRILALLDAWGLPSSLGAVFAPEFRAVSGRGRQPLSEIDGRKAIAASLIADKKRVGGTILFALPHALGDVRVQALPLDDLREFVKVAE